jgi:hypothetical protein
MYYEISENSFDLYENWILSKERTQTVVGKKLMLRKIFVSTIELDELKLGWRRLHDDEFHCYLMKGRSWNW